MTEWLCPCGESEPTVMRILPVWSPGARRSVVYDLNIFCSECAQKDWDEMADYHRRGSHQDFPIRLTCSTKEMLVKQILAQAIGKATCYIPKTDIREALCRVTRAS